MSLKKQPALIQRDRMGKYAFYILEPSPGHGDQLMRYAETRLSDDSELVFDKKVIILVDTSMQSIFDWNYSVTYGSSMNHFEHIFEGLTGMQPRTFPE